MSREAFGDPPEGQEPPQICPVCGEEWHTEGCEFGEEVSLRLKAERDAHKLAFENAGLRREVERLHGLLTAAQPELALFFRDLRNHLLHVIDMSKGEHYLDVVRLNAQALIRRMELLAAAQVTSDRPLTPGCRTPEGCSENGCLGWCDEYIPEVATRCEGCAELRDQLRDLTRQSNLDAMRVGKLAEDVERHSALHARLFVEKTAAQIDAENLREVLHRMLEAPTTQISAGWKDAIRQAMSAAVPDSKTPNVPR